MIDLSIIIVNYNVKEFLLNLLDSLQKASKKISCEIIVVDNNSNDKSIEAVNKKYPSVIYLILGETHPAVRRKEGEAYRLELSQLIKKLRLEKYVKFYDQYLSVNGLIDFLKATDIYLSSSINPHQAVSGTLSYALGTGRAVISTEFAQAREIITPKLGRLVPIKNSQAITTALLELLNEENKLKQMHRQAYEATRPMLWSNVTQEYSNLLTQIVLPPLNLKHLRQMIKLLNEELYIIK